MSSIGLHHLVVSSSKVPTAGGGFAVICCISVIGQQHCFEIIPLEARTVLELLFGCLRRNAILITLLSEQPGAVSDL